MPPALPGYDPFAAPHESEQPLPAWIEARYTESGRRYFLECASACAFGGRAHCAPTPTPTPSLTGRRGDDAATRTRPRRGVRPAEQRCAVAGRSVAADAHARARVRHGAVDPRDAATRPRDFAECQGDGASRPGALAQSVRCGLPSVCRAAVRVGEDVRRNCRLLLCRVRARARARAHASAGC